MRTLITAECTDHVRLNSLLNSCMSVQIVNNVDFTVILFVNQNTTRRTYCIVRNPASEITDLTNDRLVLVF